MITEKKQFAVIELLAVIILAYSIMPIVSRIFSSYFTTYAYLFVVLITLFIIVFIYGQSFIQKILSILIPILMLKAIIYVVSNPQMVLWVYGVLIDVMSVMLGYYLVKYEGKRNVNILAIILFIIFGITAITTIIGLQIYPDAARYLATVSDANDEDNVLYNFMNIGGYEFVYMFTLIYPAIVYGFKRKKLHIAFLIVYAVFDFLVIANSGYTIALLMFIVSTVFAFFKRDLKVSEILIILVVAVIATLLLFPLFSELLNFLAKAIGNEDISYRLEALAGGTEGIENSEDNRIELYMMSLTSFMSNPLLGGMFSSYVSIGGHSFVLDTIAQYGILGLMSIVLTYRAIYVKFFAVYKSTKSYGYIFWAYLQVIVLSIINTGMWLNVLTLFLPLMFAFFNNKGDKYESVMDSKHFA